MNVFYLKKNKRPSSGDFKIYKDGRIQIRILETHPETKCRYSAWYPYTDEKVEEYRKMLDENKINFLSESFPKDEKNLELEF